MDEMREADVLVTSKLQAYRLQLRIGVEFAALVALLKDNSTGEEFFVAGIGDPETY